MLQTIILATIAIASLIFNLVQIASIKSLKKELEREEKEVEALKSTLAYARKEHTHNNLIMKNGLDSLEDKHTKLINKNAELQENHDKLKEELDKRDVPVAPPLSSNTSYGNDRFLGEEKPPIKKPTSRKRKQ